MFVVKRDGRKAEFNIDKIQNAIINAFRQVDGDVTEEAEVKAKNIAIEISDYCNTHALQEVNVETIQDMVERKLMQSSRKDVAKEYVIYRNDRTRYRNSQTELMKVVSEKLMASNVQNQNANVDEKSFGGRMGEAQSEVSKDYALNYCVSEQARYEHINNIIYIHDLSVLPVGEHNCLSMPIDKLLANGFNTRQTDVRPAQSVNTAFQLVAVLFQLQSLQQFGGVSATHLDWTMLPYVRKSFVKHFRDGLKYIEGETEGFEDFDIEEDCSIEDALYKDYSKDVYNYAYDMTKKEVYQAVEGMYHNLNTLQSRSGNQLPFTSINYGTCTEPEGRMVIKALLDVSIKGIGKLHRTPIFPCGIFQCMKGVNDKPGTPNYDLYRLALKSTSLRLYPNYVNVDWSVNEGYDRNDPKTYTSTMGKWNNAAHVKPIEPCLKGVA